MSTVQVTYRRSYDHRLRALVCQTGDADLVAGLGIPRSTTQSWLSRGPANVVTLDVVGKDAIELQAEVVKLRRRVLVLTTVVSLLRALLCVSGFRLDRQRLPQGMDKTRVLRAVENATRVLPIAAVLRVLHLSPSRYHSWKRAAKVCELEDRSSCPQSFPTQLAPAEMMTIKDMVTSTDYRHMPLRALSLYAQRLGKVCASASTWAKLVRQRGWRRPRQRVYPAKPKVGIRASKPNETWHIDVTILRLLDGTKAYVHAVIDNFSRKILAWTVAEKLDPTNTCLVLQEAARKMFSSADQMPPSVYVDSGVENLNAQVDELVNAGLITRVLAQVEIAFSNSMIEAFWRSAKHQWLYLNPLDNMATLRRLMKFYVDAHNEQIPHSAFKGQTPNEVYDGTGGEIPDQLAETRRKARQARLEANRAASCDLCSDGKGNDNGGAEVAAA